MHTDVLVHPRCQACQATFPRLVRSDEHCSVCGEIAWIEKHEPAFERVHQRADGWYGVQDYENVHPGDLVELYIADSWRPATVTKLEADGFFAEVPRSGLTEVEHRGYEGEGALWRRTGHGHPDDSAWIGPFATQEAALTVRYDHAPGYLVCGVCGWDGWKTTLSEHYRKHHSRAEDAEASTGAAGTRIGESPGRGE